MLENYDQVSPFKQVDWKIAQSQDTDLARTVDILRCSSRPSGEVLSKESVGVQKFLREWKNLHIKDNILHRTASLDGQPVEQLVIPFAYRKLALKGVHDEAGHQGKDKTLWLARQRFYWPGLEKDVEKWLQNCSRCILRKKPPQIAELMSITSSRPMELVCMDFLSLEMSKGGFEHILVVTDHFTRYAQAIPCKNQTAQTTAKALYESFIRFYSFPERLHSDQGRNFESKVIQELCKLAGVVKSRTTPFHAMGNPAERFNQTLLKMLGTLENSQKADWKTYIGPIVQAYNATKSDATGFSPHYLMFGWHPRLPIDAALGSNTEPNGVQSQSAYVRKLQNRLQQAYKLAADASTKQAVRNKAYYDNKVSASKLEQGDRVLIKRVYFDGKHKLVDRWIPEPYVIRKVHGESPVYTVQPEMGGTTKTLHRNLLLPINGMTLQKSSSNQGILKKKEVSMNPTLELPVYESDSSTSSEDSVYIIPQRRKNFKSNWRDNVHARSSRSVSVNLSRSPSTLLTSRNSCKNGIIPSVLSGKGFTLDNSSHLSQNISASKQTNGLSHSVGQTKLQVEPVRKSRRTTRPPVRYGQWVSSAIVINSKLSKERWV